MTERWKLKKSKKNVDDVESPNRDQRYDEKFLTMKCDYYDDKKQEHNFKKRRKKNNRLLPMSCEQSTFTVDILFFLFFFQEINVAMSKGPFTLMKQEHNFKRRKKNNRPITDEL